MTTEDDFQKALDKRPDDWQTRLVFADFLEERGDPRAAGYRLLGLWRLVARHHTGGSPYGCYEENVTQSWEWWSDRERYDPQLTTCRLPQDWLRKISSKYRYPEYGRIISRDFLTRREADDAAALAFGMLSAKRRAELLAQPPPEVGRKKPERKPPATKRSVRKQAGAKSAKKSPPRRKK